MATSPEYLHSIAITAAGMLRKVGAVADADDAAELNRELGKIDDALASLADWLDEITNGVNGETGSGDVGPSSEVTTPAQ